MLLLVMSIKVLTGVGRQSLGFIFGFKGDGLFAGDPKYSMSAAFPMMAKNFGLFSGPGYSITFGAGGLFIGQLIDRY